VLALPGGAVLAAPATDGPPAEQLYFSCASCHGDDGTGTEPMRAPAIAGQSQSYLERQMRYFRDGRRGAHAEDPWGRQMALMAVNYSTDAEITALADYIAAMPPRRAGAADSPRGAALYAPCAGCHGVRGEGNEALGSPRLAGLRPSYLAWQYRNYKLGRRGYAAEDSPGRQMRAATAMVTGRDRLRQLFEYIAGLPGVP